MFNYTDYCCYKTIDIHFRSVRKEYRVFCHLTIVIGMYWTNTDLRFQTFSTFNTNNIVSAIISVLFLLHPISSEATKFNWNMDDCAALIQLDGVSNSYFTVTSPPICRYIHLSVRPVQVHPKAEVYTIKSSLQWTGRLRGWRG